MNKSEFRFKKEENHMKFIINKHPWLKYFFSFFLLMTLVSCSTIHIGRDFQLQTFANNARLGITTKEQVTKWLGNPMNTGIAQRADGEHLTEWDYFYGTGQLPGMKDAKLKSLKIRFNKKGVVHSYNWSGQN